MMLFEETEYELVERILLGDGQFNDLQRKFIELFETKTIVAGPGAGKTTALAAKIVLLLRYLNKMGSKDGICIITHTNVAVNEINTTLQKAGVGNVTHPHFIGTINEFFNRFCVKPHFKRKFKHNTLIIEQEHHSDFDFYKVFFEQKIRWINQEKYKDFKERLVERTHTNKLFVDVENIRIDMANTTNWGNFDKYKLKMLEAKILRKKQGFLTHEDTFLFSKLFLLDPNVKSMLRNRFKYIFLDEFQDTTICGKELLSDLFNADNCIFQEVGDPYQTIMYGQPMPEVNEKKVFRINKTNRFGNEIAQHLNVIMPEANIQAIGDKKSFKPIILLYEEKKDIYPAYKELIKEYELQSPIFKKSIKGDKVLVFSKSWAPILKSGAIYRKKKSTKIESENYMLKRLIIDFIVEKVVTNKEKLSEVREWINNHKKIITLNSILIGILRNGMISEEKVKLKDFINNLLSEKSVGNINTRNQLFEKIEAVLSPSVGEVSSKVDEDDIFTIHSVKGETLRSALVVDFDDKPLTKILLHKYGVYEEGNYLYTNNNLLYVAMSRVTHLFVFAMHKDDCTNEVYNGMKSGWMIKSI
ncbi:hypothetical protein COM79_03435 [Bacillus cereus]|uniref:UvrD-helicase domain-containing protein n=2 Tax=Bacillus cereus group TaxID=86661 RepID=UPI000BEE7130|nr:UvrD-helicase domain-containing protein [Bacillus cereus]PEB59718.1 hypothetical protein COM79_03435 [Bacillus cereus]PFN37740.1 hypothetical protein COJ56_21770 [Bacillus thuringiensis]